MNRFAIACIGIILVVTIAVNLNARTQYQKALIDQIDDPSVKETQEAMKKLGTSSKQCAYCHGKKKSILSDYGKKIAASLLKEKLIKPDPKDPEQYVMDRDQWKKGEDGKYPGAALNAIKSAVQSASK